MLLATVAVCGCTPNKPAKRAEPATVAATPTVEEEEEQLVKTATPASTTTSKPKRPAAVPDDYEMSYRDCKVVAETYGNAWLKDELEKLQNKKMGDKLRQRAENNTRKAAQEVEANWLSECNKIVGSPFIRKRLVCASKARTVKRFDDCWYGKTE